MRQHDVRLPGGMDSLPASSGRQSKERSSDGLVPASRGFASLRRCSMPSGTDCEGGATGCSPVDACANQNA